MADLGHRLTEQELANLEKKITETYRKAHKDLQKKVEEYFQKFEKRDNAMKSKLEAGQITEEYYKQWRLAQMGRGERFEALRDEVADRMTKANQVAMSYVNDTTPGIYSFNRNYEAYVIEQLAGDVGFTVINEQTVKRLITEDPDLLPRRRVNTPVDKKWNRTRFSTEITSGILQGESIKKLADRVQNLSDANRAGAIRNARTAVTGAQNAGRQATFDAAVDMGIELQKEWVATLDGRTRHSHRMLDGEVVDYNKKFSNGLMFPGDPSGRANEVWNCRCAMIAKVKDVDTSNAQRRARDPKTGENVLIENMTYSEWAGWKEKVQVQKAMAEKQAGIKDAKTISDVETAFKKQDWFIHGEGSLAGWRSDDELRLDGLDVDSAKYVYRTYEKFFEKFPQMKGKLAAPVSGKKERTVYADCMMGFGNGGITINKARFYDYSKFQKSIADSVAKGWFSSQDIVMHELGHAVDDFLSVNQHLFGVNGKSKTNFVSNKIRAKILRDSGIKLGDIRTEVSEYATTNQHEWFAEVFSEYMSSENPRKCASSFGKWLEEVMSEVE